MNVEVVMSSIAKVVNFENKLAGKRSDWEIAKNSQNVINFLQESRIIAKVRP